MSSQPAVSTQIRTLEEEIGVQLFERRGPRIALSRIGQRLYHLAMPLVEGMDRLPDTFSEEYYGVFSDDLRIGAGQVSAGYLLPEYLKRFRESYPGLRIDVKTGTGQQRLDWLRSHELDLIVAAMDVPPPDVEFHPVVESELVLITPEDHPLAGRDFVTLEEIGVYAFVGHTTGHYTRQIAEVVLRLRGVAPKVAAEVNGWGVIMNYVAAGVGISVVPDLCLTGHDRIRKVRFEGVVPRRKYGAITRRGGPLSLAASRFLDLMVAGLPDASAER
jgi:DNA-binding transcriptional LysR family regulator